MRRIHNLIQSVEHHDHGLIAGIRKVKIGAELDDVLQRLSVLQVDPVEIESIESIVSIGPRKVGKVGKVGLVHDRLRRQYPVRGLDRGVRAVGDGRSRLPSRLPLRLLRPKLPVKRCHEPYDGPKAQSPVWRR
jgi:hypothetical protein